MRVVAGSRGGRGGTLNRLLGPCGWGQIFHPIFRFCVARPRPPLRNEKSSYSETTAVLREGEAAPSDFSKRFKGTYERHFVD